MSGLISRSQLLKAMTCDDALAGDANDELDPNRGNMHTEIFPDCGIMCYLNL